MKLSAMAEFEGQNYVGY